MFYEICLFGNEAVSELASQRFTWLMWWFIFKVDTISSFILANSIFSYLGIEQLEADVVDSFMVTWGRHNRKRK